MNIPEIKNNTINIYSITDQKRAANINTNSDVLKPIKGSTIDSISHTAKELVTDLIPIYGTIHAFKQGKIGWGIFGIVTDILTIIPVVGTASKLALALSASARGMKELSAGSSCIKLAGAVIKSEKVESIVKSIQEADISKKYIDNSIKAVAKENKIEKISNVTLDQNKKTFINNIESEYLQSSYPSLESINQGKEKLPLPYEITPSISQYFCGIIKDQKWKPGNYMESDKKVLKDTMEDMLREFNQLGDSLNKQFNLDLTRSTYIINGKIIPKDDPEKMLHAIKDLVHQDNRKLQLISTFANQAIFPNLSIHIMQKDARLGEHMYGAKNGKSVFEINTLDKDLMEISATYETKTAKVFEGYDNIKELNGYGHKIQLTMSPDKIISVKPFFYTN